MRLTHLHWGLALSSTVPVSCWIPSRSSNYGSSGFRYFNESLYRSRRLYGSNSNESAGADSEILESLAKRLSNQKFQNVVVLMGAGASVSAGIPDFRSPGTGLYDRLQHYQLPYPEAIFDLDYYRDQPKPFVELCQEIWPGKEGGPRPTLAHAFCKVLEDQGMLRRIYTQNIDGLESLAGIDTDKLVECHGHFRTSSCIKCRSTMSIDDCRREMVEKMEVPICKQCGSYVKPDIVFFGEELPARFQELVSSDTDSADLLLVMGTSLMVMPVAAIPSWVSHDCPRLLLNRERVGHFLRIQSRDVFFEGDCDDGVREICKLAGWESLLGDQFQDCR
ncbi:silent information regulator protein Sir2 [Nitzschia inconspicua]|uniref:NAD-dependent protein deacetylase n=1 Tax=Nitzschia inconspicua TaxID=303405 RepID=A0A9K3PGB8_9STRA|nr:silent information regulator protein Sir2 [Nitzschia inconspicua]